MLERYTVANINEIRKKPWLVRSEAKKWLIEFNKYINSIDKLSRLRRDYVSQDASEPVANENWDNLIILDACRYDVFKRIVSQIDSDHTLEKRKSIAGRTKEFLSRNFADRDHYDTVYVSANPGTEAYKDNFHDYVPLYKSDWDAELNTVLPQKSTNKSLEVIEHNHDKRLIVHFLQPHTPHVGKIGQKLSSRDPDVSYLSMVKAGIVSDSEYREAYIENARLAISEAIDLAHELNGRTIITSDHGELLGERMWPIPVKEYFHHDIRRPELIDVPWLIIDRGSRRRVTASSPKTFESVDDREIQNKLEALGYR